jgi:hypothetical protein
MTGFKASKGGPPELPFDESPHMIAETRDSLLLRAIRETLSYLHRQRPGAGFYAWKNNGLRAGVFSHRAAPDI